MDNPQTNLCEVATPEQWQAYHWIRRTVLFEPNGYGYSEDHPDDHTPGNVPVLLELDGTPIGAMRIDLKPDAGIVTIRTMGIAPEHQRHGYGRTFLGFAEQFAASRGCTHARLVAAKWAVGFYAKCGYEVFLWDPEHPPGNGKQMRKGWSTIGC